MLIAGGDAAAYKLGGIVALASYGDSVAASQFYNGSTNAFVATTTALNTDREGATAIALPNAKVLIVGGEHCFPQTYGTTTGFQCNALQTAELYNETTKSFTYAGRGSGGLMTTPRTGPTATLIGAAGPHWTGRC